MANENKNEKAGAVAPATPSKVEGTHTIETGESRDLQIRTLTADLDSLKVQIAQKDEYLAEKDQQIQTLTADLDSLKVQIGVLEGKLEKASKKGKGVKTEKRFVVVSAFRGNVKSDEGRIYNINDDVTDLDPERLKNLVERELVKEVI